MNKDIIYIDVEDDITAIIGKIKASKDKIVALVPPKRIGVLQSAVNLRLLARMAESSNKHLVLITNNQALIALTAVAKIPVAKNLQSKPEIAEIAALEIDEGEDIIDGAQLPVGELAKTADIVPADDVNAAISTIDIEKESQPLKSTPKIGAKVPDFSRFRKKLFLGGLIVPFIIAFFVWAIWFAPAAKIIITAQTSSVDISKALKLGGSVATDVAKNIIQTITKQLKKDVSVDFTATGQKDLGVKASGIITIRNCDSSEGFTLPAGREFSTTSAQVYVSTESVSVPTFTGLSSACTLEGDASGKATVNVEASASGETYNNAGVAYTISSIPSTSFIDAIGGPMAGGTTRMATVVIAEDVQKAGQALVDLSSDAIKQQLIKQFTNGEFAIGDSFAVVHAAAVSVPAIGAEAIDGKAKLTSASTFSIIAIAKSELEIYIKDVLNKQIGSNTKTQRIYDEGIDKVVLSGYLKTDLVNTVNFATTGQIGPNIDPASIKEQVKGMRYGDIQALLSGIQGVSNVDTKFSYFWVNTVPDDVKKIDVEFVLQND